MKKRKLLYISLVLLLVGCAKEADLSNTQSGEGKTPLLINATLSTGRAQTRASGYEFSTGDQLKVYLRHTKGGTQGNYTYLTPSPTDYANKLVTFTKGESGFTSTAYWDDFSDPNSEDTNIRATGHGLHSFYSYCYNGGTPSTTLTESNSVLGWTVQQNQSTAEAVQHSDILWSPEQTTVQYVHSTAHSGAGINHGTIELPFTHAMSQITVTVTAADGFDGFTTTPLTNTVLTLNNMHTVSTLTARTSNWEDVPGDANANVKPITMYGAPYTSGLTRDYTAIVAPGTILKQDEKLLDITNADGNNYTDTITTTMIDNTHWGTGHTIHTDGESKKYIITQPGKNYHLALTIKKSAVQAHATLTGWSDVNASGEGKIVLDDTNDNLIMDDSEVGGENGVKVIAVDKNKFTGGSSFSLFRIVNSGSYTTPSNRTNDAYDFCTISTFQDNDGDAYDEWVNAPIIYWPNVTDQYYFRALATYTSSTQIASVGSITPSLNKGVSVSQGTTATNDILWGTTAKHNGHSTTTYNRGVAIPPRKGGVPIAFEHAMSKVTFNLETTGDESVLPTNAKVDLTGATIAITNLYTDGTISIETGNITGGTKNTTAAGVSSAIPAQVYPITNLFVIPQAFDADAKVVITLPNYDNAVYSIPLKDCVESGGTTPITAWERGKNYTYTIHVEKERVQTHVLVKDWEAVAGSGTATLEW